MNIEELRGLHHLKLKAMLSAKGLVYTDRARAIDTLADDAGSAETISQSGKLDRTRPFGEVFGDDAARYIQDGCYFNTSGERIN